MRSFVGLLVLFVFVPAGHARAQTFTGTIYVMAGKDILHAELYRARGSLATVERVTEMGRVSSLTAFQDRLAVSNALGTGSDRPELARLDRNPVLPGRLVDSAGQLPVYSPSGRLLFTRPRYDRRGGVIGTEVIVARADGSKRHRARTAQSDRPVPHQRARPDVRLRREGRRRRDRARRLQAPVPHRVAVRVRPGA